MNVPHERRLPILASLLAVICAAGALCAQDVRFRRGDVNDSGDLDIADPVALLFHTFIGQPAALGCARSADTNDDSAIDVSDAIALLAYLFLHGPDPAAPFPDCGLDATPDGLTCETTRSCADVGESSFAALLESATVMLLDDVDVASIDGLAKQDFDFLGLIFDADLGQLRGPPLPLRGKWLEVGGKRYMTDRSGMVVLPAPVAAGTPVSIFWQVADGDPLIVLDGLETAPGDQQPPVTLVSLPYKYPTHMDDRAPAGRKGLCAEIAIPPGCPGTNVVACCEDYLGPLGDGVRYERSPPCLPLATRNYYGSQCYEWTFLKRGMPCFPEGAINHVGPGCWINHRYRNCQNLDEDDFEFRQAPAALVRFGEEVIFYLRNNTAANSTVFRIEPDAGELRVPDGSGYQVVRDGDGWRLDQWNEALETHYLDANVVWQLPDRDPSGKCVAIYTITAMADGLVQTVPLRVVPKQIRWQGTASRTEAMLDIVDVTELTTAEAAIDFWDADTGAIAGTVQIEYSGSGDGCTFSGSTTTALPPTISHRFRIDFGVDPPTYRARVEGEPVPVDITLVCPDASETGAIAVQGDWMDSETGGVVRELSADGCECRGTNRVLKFLSEATYEWNLRMIPPGP